MKTIEKGSTQHDVARRGWVTYLTLLGSALLGLCFATPIAYSNPSGANVRFGDVRLERSGNQLRVFQGTDRAIIDWDDFSIRGGESTRFRQPRSASAVLNRVRGGDISRIDGSLFANGNVFLLNPSGIIVGKTGVIDTGGFVGSTLDISDSEFLAGGDLNFRGSSQAGIVNLGTISAAHGDVFLMAATVDNSGFIRAPKGTVGLAAGNDILLKESGEERVFVRGASGGRKENGVINKGDIEANVAELKSYGGNVYGMAVNNQGRVAATGISREGGQLFLRAGGGGKIRSTGTLTARRPTVKTGGNIVVDSGTTGRTEVGGKVDASGEAGTGGSVVLLGDSIDVFRDTLILADGDTGGGRVYIGGGREGNDVRFSNATDVTVRDGTVISASGGRSGDGGQVIVFANRDLNFQGHAAARGGAVAGDGGFVELSGKRNLVIPSLIGAVDIAAPNGSGGTLLIDPNDIEIISNEPGSTVGGSPAMANQLIDSDISNFLSTQGSLIIKTNEEGTGGNGDIFVRTGVDISWTAPAETMSDLTFVALRDFIMDPESSIMADSTGSVSITAGRSVTFKGPDGEITTSGASIETIGGDISIRNPAADEWSNFGVGVLIDQGSISSGDGNIEIVGIGVGGEGVELLNSSFVGSSGSGSVSIDGTARVGDSIGIRVEPSVQINANTGGTVTLTGEGSGAGEAILFDVDSPLPGGTSLIGGDGMQSVVLGSRGGTVDVSYVEGMSLSLNSLGLTPADFRITDSSVSQISSNLVGNLNYESTGSGITVGGVSATGSISIAAADFMPIGGSVSAGTSVEFLNIGSPSMSFELLSGSTIDSPSITFDGGTSGGFVRTYRDLDITGHSFISIEEVQAGSSMLKLTGPAGGADIALVDFGFGGSELIGGSESVGEFSLSGGSESVGELSFSGGSELVGELPLTGGSATLVTLGPIFDVAALIDGVYFTRFDEISGGDSADSFSIDLSPENDYYGKLSGGGGNDSFTLVEGGGGVMGTLDGGGDFDTLDYSSYMNGIDVTFGDGAFPQVNQAISIERVVGSSAEDTLRSGPSSSSFRILSNNAGEINGGQFESFENLVGGGSNDVFTFLNQATVNSVAGGNGSDLLWIDDRNLGGTNTYTIAEGQILRNPIYNFGGIEVVQLSLGNGNDTVVTGPFSFTQVLDAGGGNDTLVLPGGVGLDSNPILFAGGQPIVHSNFENPAGQAPGGNTGGGGGNNGGGGINNQNNQTGPNPGTILTQQVDNDNTGGPLGEGSEQNNFNSAPSSDNGAGNLQNSIFSSAAGAFSAAVAGQATVILVDGSNYLVFAPAALDGTFSQPPIIVISELQENSGIDVFAELAEAIGYDGPALLIYSDGPYAIDLIGPPDVAIQNFLSQLLDPEASGELYAALEMTLAIPITSEDGVVSILTVPVQPGAATIATLTEILDDASLAELTAALDG